MTLHDVIKSLILAWKEDPEEVMRTCQSFEETGILIDDGRDQDYKPVGEMRVVVKDGRYIVVLEVEKK